LPLTSPEIRSLKALIQRVEKGSVRVEGREIGRIGVGFVVLLGTKEGDSSADAAYMARKTAHLRVFPDEESRMNKSLLDIDGEVLIISQFTLYADTRKGNRPSFIQAGNPEKAEVLYEEYVAQLAGLLGQDKVKTGRFGAMMKVDILNDGPVTIELCSDHR